MKLWFVLPAASLVVAMTMLNPGENNFDDQRSLMVRQQIAARGISDPCVLAAMEKVPRHRFVPRESRGQAYEDHPLGIGFGQTISQPYIVAYMTEQLALQGGESVLEIGTGSGYQAAVLSECAGQVVSVEIIPELARRAQRLLEEMGFANVAVYEGDGYQGWPEEAPYDAIMVTAAPDNIPENLVKQLKEGGRMVIPVGSVSQELWLVTKTGGRIAKRSILPVRFVPMVHGTP